VSRRQEPLDADVPCGRGLRLVDAYATRTMTHRMERGSAVLAEIALHGTPPPVLRDPLHALDPHL
jgi:hypothetical protein